MNTEQIKYVPNKFESFTSTRSFALGSTGVNIPEGSEILFDGTTVAFNEARYTMPTLRGAIRLGWLTPSSQYDPDALAQVPVSANIGIRPAVNTTQSSTQPPSKSMAVTVQSDERVVMTRSDRTASVMQTAGQRALSTEIEPQDPRPVARAFKTPTKATTDLSHAGAAISKAESVKIEPGQGLSENQYLSRLSPEAREEYLLTKEAKRSAYVQPVSDVHQVVGKVHKVSGTTQTDGFTTTLSVGGGGSTQITDLSGLDSGKVVMSQVSAEGISFRNTNGPKRAFASQVESKLADAPSQVGKLVDAPSQVPVGTMDARRIVAKALCSDFPGDYDFNEHWKRRLARIQLNYSDRLDVVRAIFAAESDDFKRLVLEEFPAAFQS